MQLAEQLTQNYVVNEQGQRDYILEKVFTTLCKISPDIVCHNACLERALHIAV